ncbi:MAG: PQQ-dependent sugar dehydrogenase [Myxococcota bacterium]
MTGRGRFGRWIFALAIVGAGCRSDEEPAAADTGTSTGAAGDSTGTVEPGMPPPPRPETRHCRFDGWAPGLLPRVERIDVVETGVDSVSALAATGDGEVWLGSTAGSIFAVDPKTGEATEALTTLDAAAVTGLARHGSWLFVRSETQVPVSATRVDRYDLVDGHPDPASVVRVIRVLHPDAVRAGAGLSIDDQGLLLVPLGDHADEAGSDAARDPMQDAGNVLRVDVSELGSDYGYAIPPDNPWGDETWAVGLRDPAGCTVDSESDEVWCVDRGESVSEASMVSASADLGWPVIEGRTCLLPNNVCARFDLAPPQLVYEHDSAGCGATPGAVYRGGDPLLQGALLIGDRCSGELWGVRVSTDGSPTVRAKVAQWSTPPVAIDDDAQGQLWVVDAAGALGRLRSVPLEGEFPTSISESGCFDLLDPLTGAADVVPYEINAPLWTDGAAKARAIILPPGEQLGVHDDGSLEFPLGTTILKTFSFAFDDAQPEQRRPVETRVMLRREYGWEFHSYQWNEEGTDAQLLDDRVLVELPLMREGALSELSYAFPSRATCAVCHGSGEGRVLGARLDQMSRVTDYGTGPIAQLEALSSIGMFDRDLPSTTPIANYEDEGESLEIRTRAYLHANCGHCHRPEGWVPEDLEMDLRWTTSLLDTGLCDPVQYGTPLFPVDHRIAPGDPEQSLVWLRASDRGDAQMPPTGTFIVDPAAAVIEQWIESIDDCP